MTKQITIGERTIQLRCSALMPRLYRRATGRDLIRDMNELRKNYNHVLNEQKRLIAAAQAENRDITEEEARGAMLSVMDLEVFENLAWACAYDADKTVPADPDEWLSTFEGPFDIYQVFPVIIDLWNESNRQTSVSPKK